MDKNKRHLIVVCALIVSMLSTVLFSPALAQSQYPSRPLTIIVPFAAGGAFDILARSIGNSMSKLLGQPVIVEDVSGAGGTIGAAKVVKANPDGYTILMGSLGPNSAASALYKNLSYNPRTDFEPIILVATTPMVLVIKNDLTVSDLNGFVRYARSQSLSAGTAGVGSIADVALLLFSHVTDTKFVSVSYRSLPLSMNDLIAGRVDLMFDQIVTSKPHILGKQVRALAVTSPQRSSIFPEIPTMAELGYPKANVVAWGALFAPKDTPQPIISALNEAANRALQDPAVEKVFSGLGAEIAPPDERTPQALKQFVNAEIDKWTPLLVTRAH